jgi:hypothetical protein
MPTNYTHLDALNLRLSHERARLAAATSDRERAVRAAWISQTEREIAGERAFLGLQDDLPAVDDDELLAELLA